LKRSERVLAIDVHTGLGKHGDDTLLIEAGVGDPLYQNLEKAFGNRVAPWDADGSVAYQIHGGHPDAIPRILDGSTVEFVTQEFGTIPALRVLFALRQENRWHHYGDGSIDHPAKRLLMDAFRPDTDGWRKSILGRGRELLLQSRDRLAAEGEA
jgi:hypothetical protein